jgi:trans-aconitate 2-methyltransferase
MPTDWNPDSYLTFAEERARPALDLIARIPLQRPRLVYDLGCGPGNSTALLAQAFPSSKLTGIDKSPAMIAKARETVPAATFQALDVALWRTDRAADLVFSNALFHWLPDHPTILQRILKDLKPGAILALQMPDNLDEPTHEGMRQVAADPRWHGKLDQSARARGSLLSATGYYDALGPLTSKVEIWRTAYHHAVPNHAAIGAFFASTGLKPFLDPLGDSEQAEFLALYRTQLENAYPTAHDGKVLFAMPRLFILAEK